MQADWNQVIGGCHWLNCICKMLHLLTKCRYWGVLYIVSVGICYYCRNTHQCKWECKVIIKWDNGTDQLIWMIRHRLSMSYSSHWHLISLLIQGMSKRWLRQRVNISEFSFETFKWGIFQETYFCTVWYGLFTVD